MGALNCKLKAENVDEAPAPEPRGRSRPSPPSATTSQKHGRIPLSSESWTTSGKRFRHAPLDHSANSIRLLEVLPCTSFRGLVNCHMYHTTIDNATYKCLSYQWGPEGKGGFIRINGKAYFVRRNLLHFLQRARTRYHSEPLWIDALCIDQDNDLERNHQVQLMGQIYTYALEVYVWLGDTSAEDIGKALRAGVEEPPQLRVAPEFPPEVEERAQQLLLEDDKNEAGQWPLFEEDENKERAPGSFLEDTSPLYGIEANSLWSRAWVTQEVTLGRTIRLIRRDTEMDHREFFRQDLSGSLGRIPLFSQKQRVVPGSMSLLSLLCRFHRQKCSIQRDRIFSLHALCIEGPRINVDYLIPEAELLLHTLEACIDRMCFCSAAIVATALNIRQGPDRLVLIHNPTIFSASIGTNGTRYSCPVCGWGIDWYSTAIDGHLMCLCTYCPGLGVHFFLETPGPDERLSKFYVLGPTERHTNYVAHIKWPLRYIPSSPENVITIQMPLQTLIDFDYTRGILYYDEGHLNRKKGFIEFLDSSEKQISGPRICVEEDPSTEVKTVH